MGGISENKILFWFYRICLCYLLPLVFPSCPVVPWGAGLTNFQRLHLLSYLRVISVDSAPSPGDESPGHPFIHSPVSVLAAAAAGTHPPGRETFHRSAAETFLVVDPGGGHQSSPVPVAPPVLLTQPPNS